MKLYTHYKNKPYKFVGIAKHSETLEDLVIYETRYENPTAKLWVRPKGMFFEKIKLNGKSTPRFRKMDLHLQETNKIGKAALRVLAKLVKDIFGEWDAEWFHGTFDRAQKPHLILAYIGSEAVGFKLGYEKETTEFYSWLGGVISEFRGLGIASALMKAQHEFCLKKGYRKIQTKSMNRFPEMMILNLKNGFEVVGTQASDSGLKILMVKKLT